jgi:hypothetical protein
MTMRRSPGLALVVSLTAAVSSAAAPVHAGLDVGVLMREEAAGHHTPLLQLGPRASLALHPWVCVVATYGFSLHTEGTVSSASTQYHRFSLGPELRVPTRSGAFTVRASPALHLSSTSLYDRGVRLVSGPLITRAALSTRLAFEVDFPRLSVRASAGADFAAGRTDYTAGLGLTFPIGGAR